MKSIIIKIILIVSTFISCSSLFGLYDLDKNFEKLEEVKIDHCGLGDLIRYKKNSKVFENIVAWLELNKKEWRKSPASYVCTYTIDFDEGSILVHDSLVVLNYRDIQAIKSDPSMTLHNLIKTELSLQDR